MKIEYVVLDPVKNITVLVKTPVEKKDRSFVADIIMKKEPDAEQLGFIKLMNDSDAGLDNCDDGIAANAASCNKKASATFGNAGFAAIGSSTEAAQLCGNIEEGSFRENSAGSEAFTEAHAADPSKKTVLLEMAGGEFCGNASRSAAFYTGAQTVICAGQTVRCEGSAAFIPKGLKGIHHEIMPIENEGALPEKASAEAMARSLAESTGADAVGLMFFCEKESKLWPLVFVPGADTMFWENSCASGSAATAEYLCKKNCAPVSLDLLQPGGVLHVETTPESDFIRLDGSVLVQKESFVEIT